MKRLTERRNGLYYDIEECVVSNCSQKLGQLEDIEEELGIDLITLFKILEQGYVYTTFFNNILEKWYFKCIEGISTTQLGERYLEIVFNENEYLEGCCNWVPDWKEYGENWSLEKQDLTNGEIEE